MTEPGKAIFHTPEIQEKAFLVTGGAGFIGSNIVEYLLTHKASKVRVLDNLSNGFLRNLEPFMNNPSFEFIEGDITDLQTCMKACDGIQMVTHQAALVSSHVLSLFRCSLMLPMQPASSDAGSCQRCRSATFCLRQLVVCVR